MALEIVGRDQELETVDGFLADLASGACGMLLTGPPGIGKTAIWQAALSAIERRGHRVLSCRAVEAEARLSYASLADLIGDPLDEIAETLTVPQRRALDVALLREPSRGRGPDRRAVSIAVLRTLQSLAHDGSFVMAIDDVQWIDGPSAHALSFALRRLDAEAMGVIATLREAPGSTDPLDLLGAFDRRLVRMSVGPLSVAELARVVRASGHEIARPLLVRVHQAARGNPLFALEIVRAFRQGRGELEPGGSLPIPEDLLTLLRARIEVLPEDEREALLVASATPRPTIELIGEALETPARDLLQGAEASGIVRVQAPGGEVAFTHPLLASAVYQAASSDRRRRTHLRLASVVRDGEEHARHLALASTAQDEQVAKVLERAAEHAYLRGAPEVATELWELARRATPIVDGEGRHRRGMSAAACAFEAGDVSGARRIADEVLSASPPGEPRAEVLELMSSFAWNDVVLIRPMLESVLGEAPEPSGVLAAGVADLAWVEIVGGDLRLASDHARRAIEISERSDDQAALSFALATAAYAEFMLGRDVDSLLQRATTPEQDQPSLSYLPTNARNTRGAQLMWSGDLVGARRVLEQFYQETVDRGRHLVLWETLVYLAELETRAGNYARTLAHTDELLEVTVEAGYEGARELGLWLRSLARAHLGDVTGARSDATEGLAVAQRHGDLFHVITNLSVLGFVEVSVGDFGAAAGRFESLPDLLAIRGIVDPGIYPFVPDAVEALVGIGQLERGREILGPYQERGMELDRPMVIATAARCEGILLAAEGDLDAAQAVLEHAIYAHDRGHEKFELARTLLVAGDVRRRAKRKRSAKEALDRACEIFDELATPLWSARARSSLARVSGRHASGEELTETERQIAQEAAEGKTNREVAEALFVSEKTVEANLSRVYRKLRISSRRRLAERLRDP